MREVAWIVTLGLAPAAHSRNAAALLRREKRKTSFLLGHSQIGISSGLMLPLGSSKLGTDMELVIFDELVRMYQRATWDMLHDDIAQQSDECVAFIAWHKLPVPPVRPSPEVAVCDIA
jgi:hypothetical protein